jgi:hypothetical protein
VVSILQWWLVDDHETDLGLYLLFISFCYVLVFSIVAACGALVLFIELTFIF